MWSHLQIQLKKKLKFHKFKENVRVIISRDARKKNVYRPYKMNMLSRNWMKIQKSTLPKCEISILETSDSGKTICTSKPEIPLRIWTFKVLINQKVESFLKCSTMKTVFSNSFRISIRALKNWNQCQWKPPNLFLCAKRLIFLRPLSWFYFCIRLY